MENRFTKISATGLVLAPDADDGVGVLDNATSLMWVAGESKRMTWKDAGEYVKTLTVAGFTDWRLPTVEELFCLADHTKFNPAIDKSFFPQCDGGWYWSSDPLASSPGVYAWYVDFYDGGSFYSSQDDWVLARTEARVIALHSKLTI
jgi:hypothetical protein